MPHPDSIAAMTITGIALLLLAGCQSRSKLEQDIIAEALRAHVVHLDTINRQQLDALARSYQGQVILVAYWATSSPMSMQKFPHAMALSKVYGEDDLRVVTVSMDSPNDRQRVIDFLAASGATAESDVDNFISMYGGAQIAYQEFDIPDGMVPFFQLFDRAGRLAHTYRLSSSDINRDVEALLDWDPRWEPSPNKAAEEPQEKSRKPLFPPRPLFEDDRFREDVDDTTTLDGLWRPGG